MVNLCSDIQLQVFPLVLFFTIVWAFSLSITLLTTAAMFLLLEYCPYFSPIFLCIHHDHYWHFSAACRQPKQFSIKVFVTYMVLYILTSLHYWKNQRWSWLKFIYSSAWTVPHWWVCYLYLYCKYHHWCLCLLRQILPLVLVGFAFKTRFPQD